MLIKEIQLNDFRNFQCVQISAAHSYNIFYGDNGSGKTAVLEALFLLAFGRSFRTRLFKRIIQHKKHKLSVFAKLIDEQEQIIPLGIEKTIEGDSVIKIANNSGVIAEVAQLLPVQLLNNDSFSLIATGPKCRRQFIDWGLFHVKQSFLHHWRNYQKALKQRNILLRQKAPKSQIQSWDLLVVESCRAITDMRREYVTLLIPLFLSILKDLLSFDNLNISFQQGWANDREFPLVLQQAFSKDFELGYTYYGAHRADLKFHMNGIPVVDVLSRGQQKIFVWALRLAQGLLLTQLVDKQCIYLIDDLTSELDLIRRKAIYRLLRKINAQVFITSIVRDELILEKEYFEGKMFHVKHNKVMEEAYFRH